MRFYEMDAMNEVPKTAGVAKLNFEWDEKYPRREGNDIIIPRANTMEMFKLQPNWEQFLVVIKDYCFFGGTDEQPFLVRLAHSPFIEFNCHGIESFYEALLPPRINKLSREFGVELKRQGDIFAMPLKWDREKINDLYLLLYGEKAPEPETCEQNDKHIFGTRHELTKGSMFEMKLCGDVFTLVESGIISAPDHKDMQLPSLHIIEQASNLYTPKKAD